MTQSPRFRIVEAVCAADPLVALIGELVAGELRLEQRISVPLNDGSRYSAPIFCLSGTWPDTTKSYQHVRAGQPQGAIGIFFHRNGSHRADDIVLGEADLT